MRIVLNADDFGASTETVRATIACAESGGLTGATIMAGMPAAAEALAFATARPELAFGVHLTLAGDGGLRPLSPQARIPSLVDPAGHLLGKRDFRRLAIAGRLPVDELAAEIEAQLGLVRDHGVPISHVDSHHHVHKLGPVRRALCEALPRFGIERVRAVQNVWVARSLARPTVWLGPVWQRRLRQRFRTTEHFFMPSRSMDPHRWPREVLQRIEQLRGSTLEVGVHPGLEEGWRRDERLGVALLAREARAAGHELVTWRQI